jgi:4-diphosphocytidyl-2-C-methyl-D-erythritol kinase
VKPAHIRIQAPAKINLILRVLDRRPDGYHEVWSLMQTIGLCDDLFVAIRPGSQPEVDLRCDAPALAADQANLVYRAAAMVLERTNYRARVSIELKKRIPMGAGLGGGSSDAAATILALNRLLELGWSESVMADIGQALGSDVPFFFVAPTAVAKGRGEQARPLALAENRWVLLVNPGFPVETRWAYQQLASSRSGIEPVHESLHRLEWLPCLTWDDIINAAVNDFETPVFGAHPLLREIKMRLIAAGADMALLSGSGATMFGIFHDKTRALQAQAMFSRDERHKVFLVETCGRPPVSG